MYAATHETVPDALDLLQDASSEIENEDYDDAEAAAAEAVELFDETLATLSGVNEDVLEGLTEAYVTEIASRRSNASSIRNFAAGMD